MPLNQADIEKLTLTADYHTHTVYSHGTGTIEQNVREAVRKGLKEIAITDHGFRHWMIAISPDDIPKMRAEIDALKAKYPIDILLGIEANIISMNGDLDISEEQAKQLDILLFGAHFTAKPTSFKNFTSWWLRNLFFQTKAQREKNANAYAKAIRRYKPKIVTHINHMLRVDCAIVARAAAEVGTLIELNGKRADFSQAEIDAILDAGANFVISSDAHSPERVGDAGVAFKLLAKREIPLNRIVNLKY